MYDRTMLTVLPAVHATPATGIPAALNMVLAAGTEGNAPHHAAASGVVDSLLLQWSIEPTWDTTALVLAVHINDVEVGTVTVPDASALQGELVHYKIEPKAGVSRAFKPGDVLKVEIKTQPADSGVPGGAATPYLGVRTE